MSENAHEPYDQNARDVILWATVLVVLVALVLGFVIVQYWWLASRETERDTDRSPFVGQHEPPPGPRLQTNPARDLKEFRAREEEILDTYEWVDRENGIVRIPIERAMELTVESSPGRTERDQGTKGLRN